MQPQTEQRLWYISRKKSKVGSNTQPHPRTALRYNPSNSWILMHLNVAGHGEVNVLVSFLPATPKHHKNTNIPQQSNTLRIHVLLIWKLLKCCWTSMEDVGKSAFIRNTVLNSIINKRISKTTVNHNCIWIIFLLSRVLHVSTYSQIQLWLVVLLFVCLTTHHNGAPYPRINKLHLQYLNKTYQNSNGVIPVVFCTIVAVRYVNTYSQTQLYLFLMYRSLQQRHVSALYVSHHQVVVRLSVSLHACWYRLSWKSSHNLMMAHI